MPESAEFQRRKWEMTYDSAVMMRYHGKRRAFLDALAKMEPMFPLVLGSSAFAAATAGRNLWLVQVLSLGVAMFSAVTLAFQFSEKARTHENLLGRWADLRGKILTLNEGNDQALSELEIERAKIQAISPHPLYGLMVICQNEENEVLRDPERYHVSALQSFFKNICTLPFANFQSVRAKPH